MGDYGGRLIAIWQPARGCPFCGHNEQEIYETGRAWPCNSGSAFALVEAVVSCRCGAALRSRLQIVEGDEELGQILRHFSDRWNERPANL